MQWSHLESSDYRTESNAVTACDMQPNPACPVRVNPTEKERFENWFATPLTQMGGDQSIICLMIIFPLLEKILRSDLKIAPDQDLTLSDNSPALNLLAKLLSIPQPEVRSFWNCFRNGLMHRAMIRNDIPYTLNPEKDAPKPVVIKDGIVHVYVWVLRDRVVKLLRDRGKSMWKDGNHPLPEVH